DGSVSIDENVGAEVVYTASAVDDGDVTGGFTWSLTGVDQDVFAINAITGDVTMLASPDYETKSEYSFTVVATDVSGNASEQVINLLINNLDEVAAVFTSSDTAQSINENLGAGQVVYSATVDDSADISNGITFSLSDDSDSALTIDSSTGAVSLSGNPDFEAQSAYNFTVVATDAADNVASKSVSLSVTNVDESAPTITSGDSATITENTGVNQVIYTANSTDNGDVSDGVTYSLGEGSDVALSINTVSGAVTLAKNPDFETQEEYSFTLVATDAAGNTSDSQEVTVSVVDSMIYSVTHWSSNVVLEGVNTDSGTPEKALNAEEASLAITASDALDALKLSVELSIDSYQETDNAEMFQELSADVNGDGIISSADAYALLLRAARVENSFDASWKFVEMDQDNDSASYAGYVLGDVDGSWASSTSDPVINLQESELAGKVIFSFDAKGNTITGKDAGLSVDLGSGEISLSADADYETQSAYTFTMTNNFTGVEQNYTVSVINEDESAPVIVSSASVSLVENSGAGQVVYVAVADDSADASDGVSYALAAGSDAALSIDSESGDVTLAENPILSETAQYNFTVIVTDASGKSDEQAITVNVLPTPDSNAPVFESGASASAIEENSEVGQVIYTASASDESAVTYSLAGDYAGLTIDSDSGEVSLASSPDHEQQSEFSFTVVASDGVNQSTQVVTVAINDLDDTAPTITSGSADNDIDENAGSTVIYSATADDSADVSGGVTFSLAEGHDAALSIDAETGMVMFTGAADHEAQSSYSYTVVATDAAGNSSEQTLTLNVNDLDDADPIVTSGGDAGSIDENSGAGQVIYTATADDSADISGGVTFSLSSASSDALSINVNTGRVTLSDNPDFESADSYDFVVVATDAAGNSSEQSVSLSINNMDETAPSISSETAVSVNENSGAGQAVYTAVASDAADISAGVTFSLAEGSDSALEIDADTGVVTLADDPDQE
ncbi:cadherin repeat domain-containing protein, partial [Porticoccaceae bacterium]|nr:cadherin repeat domain-containing protein [Porticoccaceae bacterium]